MKARIEISPIKQFYINGILHPSSENKTIIPLCTISLINKDNVYSIESRIYLNATTTYKDLAFYNVNTCKYLINRYDDYLVRINDLNNWLKKFQEKYETILSPYELYEQLFLHIKTLCYIFTTTFDNTHAYYMDDNNVTIEIN